MANPRGMKVFAVERHGLPQDFVSFCTLCEVQPLPLVFAPNRAVVCLGSALVAGTGKDSAFQVCVFLG